MEKTQIRTEPPITLRIPVELLVLPLLFAGFFGVVLICLGAAAEAWEMCAAGGAVLAAGIIRTVVQKNKEIVVEADRMVVRTLFSQQSYPYAGKNLLLRRSWTVTTRRTLVPGGGLADVAIQLRQGNRTVLTVPVSWGSAKGIREAMAFLEGLPNPKQYL